MVLASKTEQQAEQQRPDSKYDAQRLEIVQFGIRIDVGLIRCAHEDRSGFNVDALNSDAGRRCCRGSGTAEAKSVQIMASAAE